MDNKKAVLVVSFGTSFPDVIDSCIAPVESDIANALPGYDKYRAFTSKMIMKKLRNTLNVDIDDPITALEKLSSHGYDKIVVTPTHILPGTEYHDLLEIVKDFAAKNSHLSVAFSQPLFYDNADYERVARAISKDFPKREDCEAILLFGHGSVHFSNACYFAFQYQLNKDFDNVFIGNVESEPTIESLIPTLKARGVTSVHLLPLMLVAGDHAKNDMAGDEDDSWKSILERNGISVTYSLHGMGENEEIRKLYVQKALEAVDCLK